jgi:hypothetical protein
MSFIIFCFTSKMFLHFYRYQWLLTLQKKVAVCHLQVATCTKPIHVANRLPRVRGVVDSVVANCTICHVYSEYTLPLCHVSHKTRSHTSDTCNIHVADVSAACI